MPANSNYTRPTKSLAILSGLVVFFVLVTTLTICLTVAKDRSITGIKNQCCCAEATK